MVTAVALLLLLNDKSKLESLQRDGRTGLRFPQTAGCKARTCFVDFVIYDTCSLTSSCAKQQVYSCFSLLILLMVCLLCSNV